MQKQLIMKQNFKWMNQNQTWSAVMGYIDFKKLVFCPVCMLLVILYWRKSDCNENLVNYRIDYKSEKLNIYDLYKFGIFVLSHLAHKFHMKITVLYVWKCTQPWMCF